VCAAVERLSAVVRAMLNQTARAHNLPPFNRIGECSQRGAGGVPALAERIAWLLTVPVDLHVAAAALMCLHVEGGMMGVTGVVVLWTKAASSHLELQSASQFRQCRRLAHPQSRHRSPAARVRPRYANPSRRSHPTARSVHLVSSPTTPTLGGRGLVRPGGTLASASVAWKMTFQFVDSRRERRTPTRRHV